VLAIWQSNHRRLPLRLDIPSKLPCMRNQSTWISGCCACCAAPAASCSRSAHSSSRCMTACKVQQSKGRSAPQPPHSKKCDLHRCLLSCGWLPPLHSKLRCMHQAAVQPTASCAHEPTYTAQAMNTCQADLQQLVRCRTLGGHQLGLEHGAARKPQGQCAVQRYCRHRRWTIRLAAADAAAQGRGRAGQMRRGQCKHVQLATCIAQHSMPPCTKQPRPQPILSKPPNPVPTCTPFPRCARFAARATAPRHAPGCAATSAVSPPAAHAAPPGARAAAALGTSPAAAA